VLRKLAASARSASQATITSSADSDEPLEFERADARAVGQQRSKCVARSMPT